MRRLTIAACLTAGLLSPAGAAAGPAADAALRSALEREMRPAGPGSGALVVDLTDGRVLYGRRPDTARVPASNQKLYTTGVALLRMGGAERLTTRVFGDGALGADGAYDGNLYLRGGGDPTFGSAAFNRRAYGTGATVEELAARIASELGIERVRGGVYGDETFFDRRRGGPDSGYAFSFYLGAPLSALSFNRGLAGTRGSGRQARPAAFAAAQLARALRAAGVGVGPTGERPTPADATPLSSVASPPMASLARLTNAPSDSFFAETLLKVLGARFGGRGSTAAGASVVRVALRGLGVRARVSDGSGLSRANRTTPRDLVRLLTEMHRAPSLAAPFRTSLAVACRTGTLARRMCATSASGRCQAKTGTLSGVSALAGYCAAASRTIAFAILMNGVNVTAARRRQDRMAAALAAYRPTAVPARR